MSILLPLLSIVLLNILFFLGKFIASLYFGIHHDHYFIGFGPQLFKIKLSGVVFSIGIYIPIIGLSRIYRMDGGVKKSVQLPWEFITSSLWKRAMVIMSGPVCLLLMSLCSFILLSYLKEEYYLSKETLNQHGIQPSSLGKEIGFMTGDKIIEINGKDYERFEQLLDLSNEVSFTLMRNDSLLNIQLEKPQINELRGQRAQLFEPLTPPIIDQVMLGSAAEIAELKKGDRFISIENTSVFSSEDLKLILRNYSVGDTVELQIERVIKRDTSILDKQVILRSDGLIGFSTQSIEYDLHQNSLAEAIIKGPQKMSRVIASNLRAFNILVSNEMKAPNDSLSGPISIAQLFGAETRWIRFMEITSYLALLSFLFNLLPFPKSSILLLFPLFYELIFSKAFTRKAYNRIVKASYFIIAAFMVYVITGDIIMLL